jgi:hypothetical protein
MSNGFVKGDAPWPVILAGALAFMFHPATNPRYSSFTTGHPSRTQGGRKSNEKTYDRQ